MHGIAYNVAVSTETASVASLHCSNYSERLIQPSFHRVTPSQIQPFTYIKEGTNSNPCCIYSTYIHHRIQMCTLVVGGYGDTTAENWLYLCDFSHLNGLLCQVCIIRLQTLSTTTVLQVVIRAPLTQNRWMY